LTAVTLFHFFSVAPCWGGGVLLVVGCGVVDCGVCGCEFLCV